MAIAQKEFSSRALKFFVEQEGKEVAHAYLYLLKNDEHVRPCGLMEDVLVDESLRGQGIGTELIKALIEAAREQGCRKLIATSRHTRPKVHALYERLGFNYWGKEFRMDL